MPENHHLLRGGNGAHQFLLQRLRRDVMAGAENQQILQRAR